MAGRPAAQRTEQAPVEIKLAHSPDSDDAFMFYALATHKLATPGYKYTHVLSDIQTLNEAALTETYDVTAVSFAAYPSIRDKYVLLDCGASFGEGYGPIGGNAVRKSRGRGMGRLIAKTIRKSVEYGWKHRDDAQKYGMQFARDMETGLADQFGGIYVNRWTRGWGKKGKTAVTELVERG